MLKGRKTKHWMRMIYSLQSLWKLKRSSVRSFSYKDYLQAGKSVEGSRRSSPWGRSCGGSGGRGRRRSQEPLRPACRRIHSTFFGKYPGA